MAFWKMKNFSGIAPSEKLYRDRGVFVVPGNFFGEDDFARVAWTQDKQMVRDALQRLGEWL